MQHLERLFLVVRPGFGCHLMVSRVFYKLKLALERDLKDWLAETRIKTSQLLYQVCRVVCPTVLLSEHHDDFDIASSAPGARADWTR